MRRGISIAAAMVSAISLLAACAESAQSPTPEASANDCSITLTHVESERAFHYTFTIAGLEPDSELPTVEWRRGDAVFMTNGPADDPEFRIDETGVLENGVTLEDVDLPAGDGEWVVEVTVPEDCGATATFDPFESR